MIPDEVPASMRPLILSPDVMAEPVVFLCSDEAQAVNDERVVAKEFARWKEERRTSEQQMRRESSDSTKRV
jgi:gluconate 5-dehydrogenase